MPSLALLAAGLALAAPAARPTSDVPLGVSRLSLTASLEVKTAVRAAEVPLAFRFVGGSWVAEAESDAWDAVVELAPAPGGARLLGARVRWKAPAEVERIAIVLSWPGSPLAVDRALRFSPVTAPLRIERGTPLLVQAGAAVLVGGPGLAAARVEGTAGGVRTTLYLDDAAARPFSNFEICFERLPHAEPGGHLHWGSFDPRRPHPFAPRAPGDGDLLAAALYPVPEGAPFVPVVVERWPSGARAAVVFTDHADRTDADALRAVLWGDSVPPRARPGAGFLGHGIRLTRTFFVRGAGGLEEPSVAELADELVAAGSEVGLHSISPDRDGREAVRDGLRTAARWAPATWIDHEPYTNCEAISAQGWRESGPFGIRDVLAEGGIRWIWAAGDEGPGQPRIDDLFGGRPDEARAAFAPFALDPRLWTFRSSMFYAPPAELAAAISEPALQALEEARGLFVAHTYLGPSARTTHSPEHLALLAVRPAPGGGLVLDPALEAALARLEAHVRAGRLASLGWAEAGDRLRALGEVEVAYRLDGAVELRNPGDRDVAGLTLRIPVPPEVELALDDGAPLGREDGEGGARVWLDLPAGGRAVLRASDEFVPLPFLPYP